jgi:hypothetical protein
MPRNDDDTSRRNGFVDWRGLGAYEWIKGEERGGVQEKDAISLSRLGHGLHWHWHQPWRWLDVCSSMHTRTPMGVFMLFLCRYTLPRPPVRYRLAGRILFCSGVRSLVCRFQTLGRRCTCMNDTRKRLEGAPVRRLDLCDLVVVHSNVYHPNNMNLARLLSKKTRTAESPVA